MLMIENLSDVKKSRFLNSLDKVASSFGLKSCYAEINETSDKGIYFFVGNNLSKLSQGEDFVRLCIKQNIQNTVFNTDIKAFKLTGKEDFVTHQHILQYMRNLELINRMCEQYKKPIPPVIEHEAVFLMRNLYINAHNDSISPSRRAHYEATLQDMLEKNKVPSKKASEYDKSFYDSGKSKLANFMRKHFGQHLNSVSLEHLTAVSNTVKTISIKEQYRNEIVSALDNEPHLLYYISDTSGTNMHLPEGEGLGSQKDNDMRKFTISFEEIYMSDFMNVIDKVLFPELYQVTPQELSNTYGDLISFSIPLYEYNNLISLCQSNNIPISYDVDRESSLDLEFVTPKQYEWEMEGILSRLAKESENFKIAPHGIVKKHDFEQIPFNNSNNSFNNLQNFLDSINDSAKSNEKTFVKQIEEPFETIDK